MKQNYKKLNKALYNHEYYLKHKEYISRRYKKWRLQNKEKLNNYFINYYSKPENKLIRNCRNTCNRMIKNNIIERKVCEVCGKFAEAHHENYEKPLEITWLCKEHHEYLHRKY